MRTLVIDLEGVFVVEEFVVEAAFLIDVLVIERIVGHPTILALSMCYIVIHGSHNSDAG